MKWTLLLILTSFYIRKGEPCGLKKISGTIGGRVTLHVDVAEIKYISWVVATPNIRVLGKTGPGQPITIRHAEYMGRLNATADGSLIITSLTREDQGQYTANVQRFTLGQCLQKFDLQVFDVLSVESCAQRTNVSGVEGGEVILPLALTGFTSITWVTVNDLVHFAVTESGKQVMIQDYRYKGCLNVTANGSLIITGLTRENQGTYGSYTVTPTSLQCVQLYNLKVLGTQSRNRHGSPDGKEYTIFTDQESNKNQIHTRMDYTTINTIRLAVSGCVLLIACCVLSHHLKTEVMSPSIVKRRQRRYS